MKVTVNKIQNPVMVLTEKKVMLINLRKSLERYCYYFGTNTDECGSCCFAKYKRCPLGKLYHVVYKELQKSE